MSSFVIPLLPFAVFFGRKAAAENQRLPTQSCSARFVLVSIAGRGSDRKSSGAGGNGGRSGPWCRPDGCAKAGTAHQRTDAGMPAHNGAVSSGVLCFEFRDVREQFVFVGQTCEVVADHLVRS